jgi:prepilin-type N-terminal cleavage/methylation domain-containing protein
VRRDARGFTLLEVIVAMSLLGVILLALFALMAAGVRRAYSGKKMTRATAIAQAALEDGGGLKRDPDATSATREESLPDDSLLTVTANALPAGRTFRNASLVRLAVEVSWIERGNRPRRVRLQTLEARP